MERLKERLAIAAQALATLEEALAMPKSKIVRDAVIQRFEYTFEALWKAAQLYLREQESIEAGSPKSVIRAARQVGLLEDEQTRVALQMAEDRNLSVHTYNELLAERIFARVASYPPLMHAWLDAMKQAA